MKMKIPRNGSKKRLLYDIQRQILNFCKNTLSVALSLVAFEVQAHRAQAPLVLSLARSSAPKTADCNKNK